ncbi:MAG: hypothetical protein GX496_12340, partial [Firmicutes bacterium]|nr:hypothetical protein [Bacillota bacterium]
AGPEPDPTPLPQALEQRVVAVSQVRRAATVREVAAAVLHGSAALLVDGEPTALLLDVRAFEHRTVDEPRIESVIRGPREGLVESLRTNTALIRRRLRTPQLKLDPVQVGHLSRTEIVVAYIRGVAPDVLIQEVKRRLSRIRIDAIIDSAYVEELIEDAPYSPFPQVLATERPDIVAANLLEGRVAVLVDGSSFALVVPVTLWSLMQASEDYYERYFIGTALRLLRYIFALIALTLPAFYIAVTTFHQEMIPSALLLTLAATREGIPFPSIVEILIMEISFEALREAGVRLPKTIGAAVTIVGALIIGQSAVQAGIVSAPVIIVVALTGIASFTFPRFNLGITIRLLRFPLMFLAAVLGLYGLILGILTITVHLAGLRSLGIPYLSPVAPLSAGELADVAIRPPIWARGLRPRLTGYPNPRRQSPRVKPGPEPWEEGEPSPSGTPAEGTSPCRARSPGVAPGRPGGGSWAGWSPAWRLFPRGAGTASRSTTWPSSTASPSIGRAPRRCG